MKNQLLETAEFWTLGLGIATLPLGYRAKRPDGRALKQAGYVQDGAPEWQRLKSELPGEDVLRLWFSGPRRNIGIITGWQDLIVIDFDDRASYATWLAWAQESGETARTVADITHRVFSARGVHVYVAVEEPVAAFSVGNIDIKAAGGYVLAPPSVHPTGTAYTSDDWCTVLRVERLADVFPFAPPVHAPAPPHTEQAACAVCDPWGWQPSRGDVSISEIKNRVNLLDFFPDAQPTSGDRRWWIAHCPFHDDRRASLWLDTRNGLCGCLAGCTPRPLDVINVYQRLHGCDVNTAMQELAR